MSESGQSSSVEQQEVAKNINNNAEIPETRNVKSPVLSFRATNFAEVAKRYVEKSSVRKKIVIDLFREGTNESFYGVVPSRSLGNFIFDKLKKIVC